jgi:hypothetical protein
MWICGKRIYVHHIWASWNRYLSEHVTNSLIVLRACGFVKRDFMRIIYELLVLRMLWAKLYRNLFRSTFWRDCTGNLFRSTKKKKENLPSHIEVDVRYYSVFFIVTNSTEKLFRSIVPGMFSGVRFLNRKLYRETFQEYCTGNLFRSTFAL